MSYLDELERKYIVALGEVKALTEEVQRLRSMLAKLSETPDAPPRFRLTKHEAAIFSVLMAANGSKTQEQLLAGAYADSFGTDDEPEIKIIDVFVCKLRKKLKPHGVFIETLWGQGYVVPPESKAAVRRMHQEDLEAGIPKEPPPARRTPPGLRRA